MPFKSFLPDTLKSLPLNMEKDVADYIVLTRPNVYSIFESVLLQQWNYAGTGEQSYTETGRRPNKMEVC